MKGTEEGFLQGVEDELICKRPYIGRYRGLEMRMEKKSFLAKGIT